MDSHLYLLDVLGAVEMRKTVLVPQRLRAGMGGEAVDPGVVHVLKLPLQRVVRIESPEAGGTVLPASRWAVS